MKYFSLSYLVFKLLGQITEQIYVGSCIQTVEDIKTLSNTAVRVAMVLP